MFMVFNATFYHISAISWQSVLLVEETGVPGENQGGLLQTSFTSLLKYLEIMIKQTLILCDNTGLTVLNYTTKVLHTLYHYIATFHVKL